MTMLAVRGLDVAYGPIRAVRGLDLTIEKGQLVALLGPNGAGKTSTMSALMGMVTHWKGTVELNGVNISRWSPERIVRQGMTLVPEGRRIFGSLTVAENLRLGAATGKHERWAGRVREFFPILVDRQGQEAGTLSGGEQQQLAMARALLSDPQVLLLDEPSLGLAPAVVDRIFELIQLLRSEGLTILLVEQSVERSLQICDHAVVLSSGAIKGAGTSDDLKKRGVLDEAFFGVRNAAG
jgi:branched-chain amino acid transport system ATP-binding protein